MSRAWRWVLPCYLFAIGNAMLAFAYAVVVCRARSWDWRYGVLTFVAGTKDDGTGRMWGNPGGQGWSWVVGFASEDHRNRDDLRVHEYTHVVQCFVFGLAGLCLVPVLFALLEWPVVAGVALGGPIGCALFGVAYGLCFLWFYAWQGFRDWRTAYRRNPFERHAYGIQERYMTGVINHPWGS